MEFDSDTKLAEIRSAMACGDWDLAIRLAAKYRSLGRHGEAIRRAKDDLNSPALYEQLGHDREAVRDQGIAALKDRFSLSWKAVKDAEDPPTSNAED